MRVRIATCADAEAISRLNERNGLGRMDMVSWRNDWETYPLAEEFPDVPMGWVLETDGGSIVGSLGNIRMVYHLGGRRLRVVIATAWAVDSGYRGSSLQLLIHFYKQRGVDLWLNVSASPTTSRVLAAWKMPRIPIPDYGNPCFWAVRPRAFAKAVLARRSTPGAALLSYPAGLILHARDVVLRSGRGPVSSAVRRLREFDDRFDSLWDTIRGGPPRLRAVRTRAALEWRFRARLGNGRAAILAAERGAMLLGYTVLTRREGSELGMDLYDVADIQAVGEDPMVLRDLLLGSLQLAREDGADAVKFMTGTPAKRAAAEALRPYTYRLPFWQLYYKVASPELGRALSSADAWDFSLFDTY